jgi:sRNA-binding carbon storage regulator CsrA
LGISRATEEVVALAKVYMDVGMPQEVAVVRAEVDLLVQKKKRKSKMKKEKRKRKSKHRVVDEG